ncbi:MAG: tRNA (N6-threonylcarbamoyladenosine(37)-N6)-methyltransferase TrmO [Deltaproteobacteria bacterium]|nr:tRNA (N6-threonylcarbamoyladenosine(37)-N6)-methyltransferase TrmO [Deltaproteobacteria bacterium]
MEETFQVVPVGVIRKEGESASVEIFEVFKEGLLGLDGFSHIHVLCWFHESDSEGKRAILQVHPRGDRTNPLTGVFATRSPRRPNPVALFASRIHAIRGNRIEIDSVDALDSTPVIDIKPYIPESDSVPGARVPGWVERIRGG